MTIRAAGILFVAPGNVALFLKRGPGGDHPNEWCFPGGTTEGAETAEQTAEREAIEELGFLPKGPRQFLVETLSPLQMASAAMPANAPLENPSESPPANPVIFSTFVQKVPSTFEPKVNGEHTGYAWAPIDAPPQPLHPGCATAIARLSMDELGVARAMAAGTLPSPQRYENVWLFALRITGTGAAYRVGLDEFVWRDPSIYLNDEFLARCNGLAVIFEHPKTKPMMDSKEFTDRIVGSIMLPYIRGDLQEVWGIGKIYDAPTAQLMREEQLSTSPGVVFRNLEENSTRLTMDNGAKILIEGKPTLLDHLAICGKGVWDKGGEPAGVALDSRKDSVMATKEEMEAEQAKKDAEEKARKDADAGTKLDKLLSDLGSMRDSIQGVCDSMASMGKRMDAIEAEGKARKDAEEADGKKKAEEEAAAKKDADEKEIAAKKDAEEKSAKEEAERKDAASRHDSVDSKMIAARLDTIQASIPKDWNDADYHAMADVQARCDSVMAGFGKHAPRPLQGETPLAYRRRLARELQPHSDTWKAVDLTAMNDEAAFNVAEGMIYRDATAAARSPVDLAEGELRAVTTTDPETHRAMTNFFGKNTFFRSMSRPSSRVTRIGVRRDH